MNNETNKYSKRYLKEWLTKCKSEKQGAVKKDSKAEDKPVDAPVIICPENLVIDIRQLRLQIANNNRITFDLAHWNNALTNVHKMNESCPKSKLYIVVDTNILLGELSLLRNIKQDYEDLSPEASFLFVIPYVILQELDLIKFAKHKSTHLKPLADEAVSFIHDAFLRRDNKVFGETNGNLKAESSDEKIILSCLQYKQKYKRNAIIFSNDFYLTNKANEHSLEVCSSYHINFYLGTHFPFQKKKAKPDNTPEEEYKRIYGDWNNMLLPLLADLLKYEMKAIYGNEWSEKVFAKPPWTLRTLLSGIKQHWDAVFVNLVVKDEMLGLNKLINKLPNITNSLNAQEIEVLLNASQSFFLVFKHEINHSKQITEVLNKIDLLKKHLKSTQQKEIGARSNTESDDLPMISIASSKICNVDSEKPEFFEHLGLEHKHQEFKTRNDLEIVKSAFANTWNFINYNCGVVIDSFGGNNPIKYTKPSTIPLVNDTCLFVRRFYPALIKLKFHLERVLEIATNKSIDKTEHLSYLELCNMLENFAAILELESTSAIKENVAPNMLIKFIQNHNARTLMTRGLEQLNYWISLMYEQISLRIDVENM